jgi:hypothetical protein
MHKLLIRCVVGGLFAFGALVWLGLSPATAAEDYAGADCDGTSCSVRAGETDEVPAMPAGQPKPAGDDDGKKLTCTYFPGDTNIESDADDPVPVDTSTLKEGDWVWVACHDEDYNEQAPYRTQWGADGQPVEPAVNVARRAQDLLKFAPAKVESWPASDHLVGVRSYFHVQNFPELAGARTANSGRVRSTATATPVKTIWNLGTAPDGRRIRIECDGAGTVWQRGMSDKDSSLCGQTFWHHTDGDVAASVEVVYQVTWTSTTGESGVLPLPPQVTPFTLRVHQLQAVGR